MFSRAQKSSISAAGKCRCTMVRKSKSTTRCAATRACSTSRTWGSSISRGEPRPRVPARAARQRCRPPEGSRQGAVFLHAAAERRRDRRSDRLLHVGNLVSRWSSMPAPATRIWRGLGAMPRHFGVERRRARGIGDDRDSGPECARKKTLPLLAPAAPRRRPRTGAVLRRGARYLVRGADRLYRRGWLRSDACRRSRLPRHGMRCAPRAFSLPASVRETRCGWKPA